MSEEEIAKDIYIHHFDDDVNYPDVLNAITVGVQKGVEFGERQSGKKIEELKMTDEYIIKTLESKVEKLQEDLRNKRISIKNKKAEIKELEEKISVLLTCKNCPENKGGYICTKEYDNKCLAQKIQHVKELEEENAELKADNDARKFAMAMSEKVEKQLREQVEAMKCCENCKHYSASCCCNLPFDDCFELSAWELRK